MGTTTTLLTFEEFEQLPDEPCKSELLDGELIQLPPAKLRHMDLATRLYHLLLEFVKSGAFPHLGQVTIEYGYKLGRRSWVIPDVSITHPNQTRGDYLEGAPLLAIEVVSESNRADHLHRKLKKYLANGGHEVWVMYPDTRSVVVHHASQSNEFDTTLSSDLLPGLTIDLLKLFAD
jgi:Uma2 family endonuclease